MMPDHGTRRHYGRGCRCDQCRGANAAYDRELRARAGLPAHGTRSTYTGGCRCDPCREANTVYQRQHHSGAIQARGTTLAKLEDLEFLLAIGEYPPRAADRVGWSVKTAQRMLHRHRPGLVDAMTEAA